MFRKHQLIASGFAMIAVLSAATAATPPAPVKVDDLHPFTHVAYVLAGSDLSSIKFDSIKLVKVPTQVRTDNRYCGNLYAEPGGSMFCPQTAYQASVPAYRVTYMYKGLPMASDEYPSTNNYTFSVLFRPEELSPAARSGAPAAESFVIATSRDLVRETVIDQAHSTFCQGYYIDGSWTHTNLNCQDQIAYKVVTVPSPYIKVTITPASRIQAAALPSGK